jgi:hypothetical protein
LPEALLNATNLGVTDHERSNAALRYVYPVVSRRAKGVSVGINLNTNNACNWRCVYCQVPGLTRGAAPPVDFALLESELCDFLAELLRGDFLQQRVPEGMRRVNDIALSGNGEPTSAAEFAEVVGLIGRVRRKMAVPEEVKTVLITNGSLIYRREVQRGLRILSQLNGEVWFKLDRGSEAGIQLVNNAAITLDRVRENLITAIGLCKTWLQTCWFALDGAPPSRQDEDDYLAFLSALLRDGHRPKGVLLYGLARTPQQAEAPRLSALPAENLQGFAARIEGLGLPVVVSV